MLRYFKKTLKITICLPGSNYPFTEPAGNLLINILVKSKSGFPENQILFDWFLKTDARPYINQCR